MAVYTRSYIGIEGSTFISDPTLAFARILDLSREGTDFSQNNASSDTAGFNQFVYLENSGQIVFSASQPFGPGGERVEIIYDGGTPALPPPEPPMTCDPVASVFAALSGSIVQVILPASGNYLVDIIPAAGTCGDTPANSGVIMGGDTYNSPALPDGSYKACVKVNCGGGLYSTPVASNTVTITTPPANFGARKEVVEPAKKLISITGFTYTIRSGSLPLVFGGTSISGRHEGFVGAVIQVVVSVVKKQNLVVALYKNGPLVQFLNVYRTTDGNVTLNFSPISALATDNIFIQMDYT